MADKNTHLRELSKAFVRDYDWFSVPWTWIIQRFFELNRECPLVRVAPRYQNDYRTIRFLTRILKGARKQKNGRYLVFTSMHTGKFVTGKQMKSVDAKKAIRFSARLAAFMNIYSVELQLSQGSSPFVELSSEMDSLIDRFRKGEANPTLFRDLIRLNRRLIREKVKVVTSTVLTLFSLYLLTPRAESASFFQNLAGLGVLLLFSLLSYVSYSTWISFAPLLRHTQDS